MKAFTPVVFLAVCLTSVSARQWDVTAQLRGPLAPVAVNIPVTRAEELYGRSAVVTKASDAFFPAISHRLTLPKGTIRPASARKPKRDFDLAELFLRSFVDDSNIFARSDKPNPLPTQPTQPNSGIAGAADNLAAGVANFGNAQGASLDAVVSGTFNAVGNVASGVLGSGAADSKIPKDDKAKKTKKTRRDLADFVVRSVLSARNDKDDKPKFKSNPRPDHTAIVKINNQIKGGGAKGKREVMW